MTELSVRGLVNDDRWALFGPLLPQPPTKGVGNTSARTVFAALVYVLVNNKTWQDIPDVLGVAASTAERRFIFWNDEDVWIKLRNAAKGTPHAAWVRRIVDAAINRAYNAVQNPTLPIDPSPELSEFPAAPSMPTPQPSPNEFIIGRMAMDRHPGSCL